ncbi:MAG: hypothetical protein HY455_03150 [Parcubacteria group bacterium]|nr:hypothetical protein [Parcubacteria group bacterium]
MTNTNKVGIVFGALLGGWHLMWSLLVLSGFAQVIWDFILWAHMIHMEIIVGPFDATAAVTLVVATSIMGYVIGYIGALVWNRIHG